MNVVKGGSFLLDLNLSSKLLWCRRASLSTRKMKTENKKGFFVFWDPQNSLVMVLNQNIQETAPVTDVALISSTDLSPGPSSILTSLLQTHEIAFNSNHMV